MSIDTDARVTATVAESNGITTTQIATAISMSKSPVAKALARLEQDGEVYRVPGGHDGKARQPDTWYHTATHQAQPGATAAETVAGTGETEPSGRLAKGELKTLVLGFLEANPGMEYGPSQLAKKLDRAAGAIANVLDKAAADRIVEMTRIRPKRYRHQTH